MTAQITVTDITPQKALALSREGFDWLNYVQGRLNETIPDAARKTGGRSCSVEFYCMNDISLAECTIKVTDALKRLGWTVGDVSTDQQCKNTIRVDVGW